MKKKTKVIIPELIVAMNSSIFGCCSIFGSYPKLIFIYHDIIVTERSRFVSDGIKNLGFNSRKIQYHKKQTLHHRRHGVDRRN